MQRKKREAKSRSRRERAREEEELFRILMELLEQRREEISRYLSAYADF